MMRGNPAALPVGHDQGWYLLVGQVRHGPGNFSSDLAYAVGQPMSFASAASLPLLRPTPPPHPTPIAPP